MWVRIRTRMPKFKYKTTYSDKNYKSEFIISCLQVEKRHHKDISWAKEMKIMNTLSKKCNDPAFWIHARPEFKIPSLAWFLTDKGRIYLNEKYKRFYSKIKTTDKRCDSKELLSVKTGEDIVVNKNKIKTLKDFLRKKI